MCAACVGVASPLLCVSCRAKRRNALAIDLGPFSVGSVLAGAWTIFTARFGTFFAIAAVFALLEAAFARAPIPYSGLGFGSVAYAVLFGVFRTSLCLALASAKAEGRDIGLREALVVAAHRWPSVLGAEVLAWLRIIIGAVLFLVPGVYQWVTLFLVAPAAFLEGRAAGARSHALVLGHRWEIFGLGVISIVPIWIWSSLRGVVSGLLLMKLMSGGEWLTMIIPVSTFVSGGIDSLFRIYFEVATLLAFYSLRAAFEE